VISTHERETIAKNIEEVLVDQIVRYLTSEEAQEPVVAPSLSSAQRDIVFRGTFEAVNAHFHENGWTDGLPVVPPSLEKIEAFLRFTDRSPDGVLGVMHPSQAQATIWNIAVNGVMAGCRPEYMPILVAIVEIMADPEYGMKHGGSTPGWEAMIILNGPIRNQLGLDSGQGCSGPATRRIRASAGSIDSLLGTCHGFCPPRRTWRRSVRCSEPSSPRTKKPAPRSAGRRCM
jgi:hypothetical protein